MEGAVGAKVSRVSKTRWTVSYARTWTEGFEDDYSHMTSRPADLAARVAGLDILPEGQYVRGLGRWFDQSSSGFIVRRYLIELEK